MVEMQLADVRVSLPTQAPVVVLQEVGGARRILFIFIGNPEADAAATDLRELAWRSPIMSVSARGWNC